jgi:hypothetical protein
LKTTQPDRAQGGPKKNYPKVSLAEFMAEVSGWKFETKEEPQKRQLRAALTKKTRR